MRIVRLILAYAFMAAGQWLERLGTPDTQRSAIRAQQARDWRRMFPKP